MTVDITAAVNRAIDEGKSAVSLVMSAPGVGRNQFFGISSDVDADKRASYSMSWDGGSVTPPTNPPAEEDGEVQDQDIDFYYRFVNDNTPVVGSPSAAASKLCAGGLSPSLENNCYTALKFSLPQGLAADAEIKRAELKLHAVYDSDAEIAKRRPFALFYMPNQDWNETTGKEVSYDGKKPVYRYFNKWTSEQEGYSDLYPGHDRTQAINAGIYEDAAAAEAVLEKASEGILKDNFLGVYGMIEEYNGDDLSIDITAAVRRAVREGKNSVSLVMSAPGTLRTQFAGIDTGVAAEHRARYSMTWGGSSGGQEPQTEVLRTFFDDSIVNADVASYKDIWDGYVSQVTDRKTGGQPVYSGEASYRIKLSSDQERPGQMLWLNWVDKGSFDMSAYDEEKTFLDFYYQPLTLWERIEVGFTCGDNPWASVRVSLADYVTITAAELNTWLHVQIPLKDLKGSKAVFAENGSGRKEFDWTHCKGFTFAGSEKNTGRDQQVNICRLDEVKLVRAKEGPGPTDTPEPGGELPEPRTEGLKTFYDDAIQNAWENGYVSGRNAVSRVADDKTAFHGGTQSYRLKIFAPEPSGDMMYMNWVDNGSFNLESYDMDTTYLELYYQPIQLKDRVEVGFTCGDRPFASLRVDIHDYVSLTNADVQNGVWKRVLIPLKDFKNSAKADFQANGSGAGALDWAHCKGFTIAVSDENAGGSEAVNICRIDDVRLVKAVPAPEELSADTGETSVTLTWSTSAAAERYEIFRDGKRIGSSAALSYTDTTAEPRTEYLYQVVAFQGNGISEPAAIKVTTGGKPALSVRQISLTDAGGNVIPAVPSAGGTLRCKAQISNTLEEAGNVTIFFAYYKNGVLSGMSTKEANIPVGGAEVEGEPLQVPAGARVKAFIWKDTARLAPTAGSSKKEF